MQLAASAGALSAGRATATSGAQGWGAAPWDAGWLHSIFSPSPARCQVWLRSSEALMCAFNFKHRSNPADFIRATHALKDLADLEKECSAWSRTKSYIAGHDLAKPFSIFIFPSLSGSNKTCLPPCPHTGWCGGRALQPTWGELPTCLRTSSSLSWDTRPGHGRCKSQQEHRSLGTAGMPAGAPDDIPGDAVGSVSSPRPPPRCYCNLYLQARDRESASMWLVLVETVVISWLTVEKGCVRQCLFDLQSRNMIAALISLPLYCVPVLLPPEEFRSWWV